MEIRQGQAQKVRFCTHTTGTESVSTHHIAVFELDGVAVQMTAGRPLVLEDGDQVVVAGKNKGGVLMGYACNNLSRKIVDRSGWTASLIVGLVFSIVGLGGIINNVAPLYGAMTINSLKGPLAWAAFFLIFAVSGARSARRALQILKAQKLVLTAV